MAAVAYRSAGLTGEENPSAGRGEAISEGRQQRIEKELVAVGGRKAVEQCLGQSDGHETAYLRAGSREPFYTIFRQRTRSFVNFPSMESTSNCGEEARKCRLTRLQNRVPRFNSGRGLQLHQSTDKQHSVTPRRCALIAIFGRDGQPGPRRTAACNPNDVRVILCYAAKYCCYAAIVRDSYGIPAYIGLNESFDSRCRFTETSQMTPLALSALIDTAPRWLSRLGRYWTEFSSGIEEARAMALRYQTLAALSDPELAARGLKRQDIPRAVLGVCGGVDHASPPGPFRFHALQAGRPLL